MPPFANPYGYVDPERWRNQVPADPLLTQNVRGDVRANLLARIGALPQPRGVLSELFSVRPMAQATQPALSPAAPAIPEVKPASSGSSISFSKLAPGQPGFSTYSVTPSAQPPPGNRLGDLRAQLLERALQPAPSQGDLRGQDTRAGWASRDIYQRLIRESNPYGYRSQTAISAGLAPTPEERMNYLNMAAQVATSGGYRAGAQTHGAITPETALQGVLAVDELSQSQDFGGLDLGDLIDYQQTANSSAGATQRAREAIASRLFSSVITDQGSLDDALAWFQDPDNQRQFSEAIQTVLANFTGQSPGDSLDLSEEDLQALFEQAGIFD